MLTHAIRIPTPPLAAFVENLWLVRGRIPTPVRHLLLPDGAVVVMINLGPPQAVCDRADVRRRAEYRASWVSGPQAKPIVIEQSGAYHVIGIGFRAGGAQALLGGSLAEFAGRVIELEDIWGTDARRLRDALGEEGGDHAQLTLLEAWLAQRVRALAPPDRRIAFAAGCLQRGTGSVGAIAAAIGWSHRHFVHEFERGLGLTPKRFGRVQRLQRALRQIGRQPAVNWAQLATAAGFYDQSHLVHEFADLTGLSPGEFLRRRSDHPGYLRVA